jgi:hypothetical protein
MSEFQEEYLKYLNDLDAYFKLKKKYENKWSVTKKKHLRNVENKRRDGKTLVNKLQKRCINCRNVGGTIFTNENNVYIAKCGSEEKKCSLNITIEAATYINNNQYQKLTLDNINDIKDKIINNKLNLLFDLENDDVVINEFNSLKEELKKQTDVLKFLKKSKNNLDIIDNTKPMDDDDDDGADDDDGENKKLDEIQILKKEKINQLNIRLDDSLKMFKKTLQEYRDGGSVKKILLNNSLNIYISNILPTLKQIRDLENNEIYIDKINKADLSEPSSEFTLVKNKYFIKDLEEIFTAYKVSKMNVKKKLYSVKKPTKKSNTTKLPTVVNQEMIDMSKDINMDDDQSFQPIDLEKASNTETGKPIESKEIKIDIDKLKELSDDKGEDMMEYIDDEIINREQDIPNLYNNDTVFKFYSRSADDPPGRGKAGGGETISPGSIGEFAELGSIKQWRKVLSNFHVNKDNSGIVKPLFTSNEGDEVLKWASVEHWYHAHKFKKNNPDYFKLFTMNSKSEISIDPRRALGAGGRTGYIKNNAGKRVLFRDASVKMDDDFFNGYHVDIMENGQRLKYNQDELSKQVLLATKDAKLVHLETRRGKSTNLVPFVNTMKIRKELMG